MAEIREKPGKGLAERAADAAMRLKDTKIDLKADETMEHSESEDTNAESQAAKQVQSAAGQSVSSTQSATSAAVETVHDAREIHDIVIHVKDRIEDIRRDDKANQEVHEEIKANEEPAETGSDPVRGSSTSSGSQEQSTEHSQSDQVSDTPNKTSQPTSTTGNSTTIKSEPSGEQTEKPASSAPVPKRSIRDRVSEATYGTSAEENTEPPTDRSTPRASTEAPRTTTRRRETPVKRSPGSSSVNQKGGSETAKETKDSLREAGRTIKEKKKAVEAAEAATVVTAVIAAAKGEINEKKRRIKEPVRYIRSAKQTINGIVPNDAQREQQISDNVTNTGKAMIRSVSDVVFYFKQRSIVMTNALAKGNSIKYAIAAFGSFLALTLVIAMLFSASGLGIFLSPNVRSDNGQSLASAMSEASADIYKQMKELDTSAYDVVNMNTANNLDWKVILTLYAVKTTTDPDDAMEVISMDDIKSKKLKKVVNDMCEVETSTETTSSVSYTTSTRTVWVDEYDTLPNGKKILIGGYYETVITTNPIWTTTKTLNVSVSQKTLSDLIESYNFDTDQKEMVNLMLSDDFDEAWAKLLGSSSGTISTGTGEISGAGFIWPLQYSNVYTTTEFGQNGHGGLDITMDGASMLDKHISAVADGTVITAGWHWSYGNYIQIDHGNGLSTIYAHCNRLDVSAGDEVRQGDFIGIVGNTGYSFGPHIHFEVRINGVRQNPRYFLP